MTRYGAAIVCILFWTSGAAHGQDTTSTAAPAPDLGNTASRTLSDLITPEIRGFVPAHVEQLVQTVEVRRDIAFAETPEKTLLMDVYAPKQRADAALPCVVWIHGGGLQGLTKDYDLIRWCAIHTARAGFVSMSIDYRLRPEAELPAAIIDVNAAVRYIRARAGAVSARRAQRGGQDQQCNPLPVDHSLASRVPGDTH